MRKRAYCFPGLGHAAAQPCPAQLASGALAYLAPAVLEKLLITRVPPPVSVNHLALAADIPWSEQEFAVFEETKLQ